MENSFEILLAGLLDEQKSLSNINTGITALQKKLKSINISLDIGNIDSEINQISKSLNKLNNGSGKNNVMSKYQQSIEDTIHKYKTGLLDLETYANRMQSLIFGKNSSTYKSSFNNLSDKSQEKYVNALNQAYTLQGKALDEVYNATKKIQTEDEKRATAINNQAIAIQKMQNALSYSTGKHSTGVDQNALSSLQSQLSALSQLNPQTSEYERALKAAQLAVGDFNKQLAMSVSSENAQSKATTDQIIAIDRLKTSLTEMASKYGNFVDANKSNEIKQAISQLEKMNPTSVAYRNQLKLIQNETRKLGTESKNAFKTTQDAISDTTAKTTTLGLAFRTLSQFFLIGSPIMLARKAFSELTTTINDANKALTDIRIVTGMSESSANSLLNTYNDLGQSIGASTKQILEGSTEWFRAGKTVSEVQELVQSSIIGSKMSGIESAQMTEYLTSALNGYKLEASDAMSVIDKMVGIDNKASTSLAELATAMSYTANTARNAGVDMNTLLSYIGTVSEATRQSAETVGTSFKTMFTRYGDIKLNKFNEDGMVTSDVIKTFDTLGITVKENENTWKDFSVVIDELAGKWNGLSEAERNAASKALAGTRQREFFLSLMENYTRSTELATVAIESNGLALNRYNEIYLQSTSAKLDKLKATIEGVFLKTLTSDTMNGFIDATTGVLSFIDACGGLIPILTNVLGVFILLKKEMVTTFVLGVGKSAIGVISTLAGKFGLLTQIITSTATGTLSFKNALYMTKTNILGIITPTQALGTAIGALTIAFSIYQMAQAKAKQKHEEYISSLQESVSKTQSELDSIDDLKSQYETLYNTKDRTQEQNTQLLGIQNQLIESLGLEKQALDASKQSWEDITKTIDANTASKYNNMIGKQREIIDDKKETRNKDVKKLENAEIAYGFYDRDDQDVKEIEKALDVIKDKYGEVFNVYKGLDGKLGFSFDRSKMSTEEYVAAINELRNELSKSEVIRESNAYDNFSEAVDKATASQDAYTEAQKKQYEMQSKVELFDMGKTQSDIENMTDAQSEAFKKTFEEMNKGEDQAYINYFKDMVDNIRANKEALDNLSDSTEETVASWDSVSSTFNSFITETDILKIALNELNTTQILSAETIEKLAEKYPQLANSMKSYESALFAINKELNNQKLDQYASDISEITDVMDKLKDGQQLSGKEISDLVEKYPQLQDAITNVNGVYGLELSALESLSATMETSTKKALEDEAKKTQQVIVNTRARMQAYLQEKKAYSALSGMTFNEDGTISDSGAFTAKMSQDENLQNMYNEYNNYLKAYKDIEKQLQNIDMLGQQADNGKDKEKESYVEKGYQDIIDIIKEKRESLSDEISKLQSQMDIAMTMHGNSKYVESLKEQLSGLREEEKNLIQSQADELRKYRDDLYNQLTQTSGDLFNGVKAEDMTSATVTQTLRNLGDDSELTTGKVKELAEAIVSANEEIGTLGEDFFSNKKTFIDEYITKINDAISQMEGVSDDRQSEIDLKISVLDETDSGYIEGVKQLQQEALDIKVEKSKQYKDQYVKLLNVIGDSEAQCLKDIKNKWIQNEKDILATRKETNEKYISYMKSQMSGITDYRDVMVDMYKYEDDKTKDALEKQKESLEEQADLRKQALESRKDELDAIKSEYDYQNKINDLRQSLSDTMSDLNALEFDDTADGIQAKIELMNKAQEDKQALSDEIINKSIEDAKASVDNAIAAIESQTKVQTELLDAEIESLNRTDKEYKDKAEKAMMENPEGTKEALLAYAEETGTMYAAEINKLSDAMLPALEEIKNERLTLSEGLSNRADAVYQKEKENTNLGVALFDGTSMSGDGSEYITKNLFNSSNVMNLVNPLLTGMKDIFSSLNETIKPVTNTVTVPMSVQFNVTGDAQDQAINKCISWFSTSGMNMVEQYVEKSLIPAVVNISGRAK